MDDTCIRKETQEGVDPLCVSSPVSTWSNAAGWVSIDVRSLKFRGASFQAIGLAAGILHRDDMSFSLEGLLKAEGIAETRATPLLRELVIAGFLQAKPGFYAVATEHRPGGGK